MNERRNAWVKETVARMRTAEKNDPASVGAVIVNNEKVIVTITKNIDNPRIGVAMVNGNDDFDLDTGLAIAYTKAKGQELPCFITCDCCDDDYRTKTTTITTMMRTTRTTTRTRTTGTTMRTKTKCLTLMIFLSAHVFLTLTMIYA